MSSIIEQKKMTAEEVAKLIQDGDIIGFGGFSSTGCPKAIAPQIAKKAKRLHDAEQKFQISIYTGAGLSDEIDGELARADALKYHAPFLLNKDLRNNINSGKTEFHDFHLSHFPQYLRYGILPKNNIAIVEAIKVTADGKIYLTMSSGIAATVLELADQIFIELNTALPETLIGLHDIYTPANPPQRREIPIFNVQDRIGTHYVQVNPDKIVGIVQTTEENKIPSFRQSDAESNAIAEHIIEFLVHEEKMGRLPQGLPYQSGVGNVANAVLAQMAENPQITQISMFTEVIQDSIFKIIDADKLHCASATGLFLSQVAQSRFFNEIEKLKSKFIIRQQEISNHPEIIRRLGLIAMNTALEVDIFGHVNSTHVLGRKMMNGIGGSGDYCRNAYLSIFMTPSTAKNGLISSFVPFVSHVDHTEHDVQIVVSERGLADLRGLCPKLRAQLIIEKCVHPDYQPILSEYLAAGLKEDCHTPQMLVRAFELYQRFEDRGSMQQEQLVKKLAI
ncbi:MAG: succinate CoA transferase [Deltaproteobacteria bacterium]|jgi:succinate CoA transferase|nr:succinate CoA transferase [Deltaproteobacteria bacterium]